MPTFGERFTRGGPGGGSPGTIWGSPSFELPDPTAPIIDRNRNAKNDLTEGGVTEVVARARERPGGLLVLAGIVYLIARGVRD